MANLTLAIDDKLLREARIKALEQGTSANEVCRRAIERLVNRNENRERVAAGLRASFANALPRDPGTGPAWEGREALYAERLDSIGKQRKRRTPSSIPMSSSMRTTAWTQPGAKAHARCWSGWRWTAA